jgi:serine/threonine protein kinase
MHASVYKCFLKSDIGKCSPYAVKTTREDDEEKMLAHRNEFLLSNSMSHPNVVKAFELFENHQKKEIHIVMEYVEGQEIFD